MTVQCHHDFLDRRRALGRCCPSRWWLLRLARTREKENRRGSKFFPYRIFFTPVTYCPSPKKQALTWGAQNWHEDSRVRTEEFRNRGPCAPTTWVLVDGRDKIPNSALEAGKDKDGHPIYIARAYYEDSLRKSYVRSINSPISFLMLCLFSEIGKASPVFKEGAAIGYGGRVIEVSKIKKKRNKKISRLLRLLSISLSLSPSKR